VRARGVVAEALALLCALAAPVVAQQSAPSDPEGGWSGLLSRPLPGTSAREDADLASSLERALAGFDGIDRARVVIVRPSSEGTLGKPSPRRAAVQVTLSPDVPVTTSWTESVATFALQAIPDLDPQELTMVDSGGHVLYATGQAQAHAVPPSEAEATEEGARPVIAAWWWLLPALLGLVAAVVVLLRTRRGPAEPASPEPEGPLGFLEALSDDELRTAFAGERAEVVGVALGRLSARGKDRLRRVLRVPDHVQTPPGPPATEVLAAIAGALRDKLERADDRQSRPGIGNGQATGAASRKAMGERLTGTTATTVTTQGARHIEGV